MPGPSQVYQRTFGDCLCPSCHQINSVKATEAYTIYTHLTETHTALVYDNSIVIYV